MFEDYQKFYNQTIVLSTDVNGVQSIDVNITDEQITSDCFFDILERFDAQFLEQHYGNQFMTDPSWTALFVKSLVDE